MEDSSIRDLQKKGLVFRGDNVAKVDDIRHNVDELAMKVEELERKVNELEQLYLTSGKCKSIISKGSVKDKDKLKHIPGFKKHQVDVSRREAAAAAKRMQELMRQFGSILRHITQHKLAWPFMHPVDVEGLGLRDYYEVIDRPMDFSTIKNQMEVKDGTGYKHVREIYADVKLVFENAMKYNYDKSDVYMMAETLMKKFEEKWQQFLPRVAEEEKRREEDLEEVQLKIQQTQVAVNAKAAMDLANEIYEADVHLDELRETVVKKCRKMSTKEKRDLGFALSRICPEDLNKALEIVSQSNPNFQAIGEEVDLDIDAQSESTLWRLKFLVKNALAAHVKSASESSGDTIDDLKAATNPKIVATKKRKSSNAIANNAKKRNQNPS